MSSTGISAQQSCNLPPSFVSSAVAGVATQPMSPPNVSWGRSSQSPSCITTNSYAQLLPTCCQHLPAQTISVAGQKAALPCEGGGSAAPIGAGRGEEEAAAEGEAYTGEVAAVGDVEELAGVSVNTILRSGVVVLPMYGTSDKP